MSPANFGQTRRLAPYNGCDVVMGDMGDIGDMSPESPGDKPGDLTVIPPICPPVKGSFFCLCPLECPREEERQVAVGRRRDAEGGAGPAAEGAGIDVGGLGAG